MNSDDSADDLRSPGEKVLCELLAVDYYEGIKALYCSDRFSKDEAGWQALIDSAWVAALAKDAARRREAGLPMATVPPLEAPGLRLH